MEESSILQTDRRNSKINRILLKNRYVVRNSMYLIQSEPNKVNLNAWIVPNHENQNVGDYLSVEIVKYMCQLNKLDMNKKVGKVKHLYAIGSILLGYQDATIWGSGFGYDISNNIFRKIDAFIHRHYQEIDIRAVRGPETRRILLQMGIECPETYGDPAVLMPRIYKKVVSYQEEYIIIPHYSKLGSYKGVDHVVGTFTTDYRKFIDKITSAKRVISASLHGLILAEAYGIPAIMLRDTPSSDITKYKDWYYFTGRTDFDIADSVEEAINMEVHPLSLDVIRNMQERLIASFPEDLWEM